jgi:UDP-2,3-diacylglucosamine hydrolase
MNTLFIADLHLKESQPEVVAAFLRFIDNHALQADAVYILGDLFEVWIGDDDDSAFNQKIMQALKKLTGANIPVYLMHGNRDFLIGKKFLHQTGCKLIKDPTCVNIYGIPALLMHGDTLCTEDKDYIKFRKKVRNRLLQLLFLLKPLKVRQTIASKMRANSQKAFTTKSPATLDVTQTEVERLMHKYHTNYLIHGHTHKPNIHIFKFNKKFSQRIVLGAWEDQPNMLSCNLKNGELNFELQDV